MPSSPNTLASTQLMTPYCESNSHCQTVIDASTGVPQASSSATCRVMRAARADAGHEDRERDADRASSPRR